MKKKTIFVDFDKTLAYHEKGWGIKKIGGPVHRMLDRVKTWINEGHKVVIFTARVSHDEKTNEQQRRNLYEWFEEQGLPKLEITALKTADADEFWDDKAKSVDVNTGKAVAFVEGVTQYYL